MLKLLGYWRSAATFRVRAALNLKGVDYEETMIDLEAGEQYLPAFTAINPAASVPALFVDDGPPITQSLAILAFLDEVYPEPALMPVDPKGKARVRALTLILSADSHPLIVPRVSRYLGEVLHVDAIDQRDWALHWVREGLAQVETMLDRDTETGRFCHGDAPTLADLCLMSQVFAAKAFGIPVSDYPNIERIAKACLALDAFAKAAPALQPGAPKSE